MLRTFTEWSILRSNTQLGAFSCPVRRHYHLISGKSIAKTIRDNALREVKEIRQQVPDFNPKLKILQVGSRPDSSAYVRMKLKASTESGVECDVEKLPEDITQLELLRKIEKINSDAEVHGILIQLPLPKHLDEVTVTNAVDHEKDVDGFHRYNVGELAKRGGKPYFLPCTPNACIQLLKECGVEIRGKQAVVIGRSDIVGTPVATMLKNLDATVTVAHRHTTNLPQVLSTADIVVAACGVPNYIKGEWLKDGAVVIDVGINYVQDSTKKSGQRLVGDVDFESAKEKASHITPVPGGVGPMTVAMLVQNVLTAAKRSLQKDAEVPVITPLPVNFEMPVPSDIDISRKQNPKHISQVAAELGIRDHELELFGHYKAKISPKLLQRLHANQNANYVLVAGITPTPLGEGKSTTTMGLVQALSAHLGKRAIANVRQPSMGPTFGVKGGAAGGGYAQVIPMDEFNLHLTGDIHAISAANNLLAAAIDTRMFHEHTQKNDATFYNRLVPKKGGSRKFTKSMLKRLQKLGINKTDPDSLSPKEIKRFARLNIDTDTITIKRVVDVNDRLLRQITIGQAHTEKGFTRTTGFDITVASELMAILALSKDFADMRERVGRMVVAANLDGEPITAEDVGCAGAVAALLKDAIKPTLMQSLEGTPVLVHAGPFANISIGASSVIADRIALKLVGTSPHSPEGTDAGYVVTEAGFDFTMGGERFLNIKCRSSGLKPNTIVIVATVRALKLHGGGPEVKPGQPLTPHYTEENLELVTRGAANLQKQIRNAKLFGVPVVVAVNRFESDTDAEIEIIQKAAKEAGAHDAIAANHWAEGGKGAVTLAEAVINSCKQPSSFKFLYDVDQPVTEKLSTIVRKMYGGSAIDLSPTAQKKIALYTAQGFDKLPICIAKTQYSLSHDATLKNVPSDFVFPIRDIRASIGAGYLYALAAEIQTIPGLSTNAGYMNVEVSDDGEIEGLF
ncbi:AER178Wp [Eremothecium gossypii ATCC 10895]|uniref:C-1-tetrahydrofolate synthase, cytoplasmic n=1 Tax=Eremothecium gossypii (strain ATCC 10895 / CBS 109.51 / FGSC 9923 / NRRL Y-1056) TaxID=284811 RepID=Q756S6_EREGS|nr:AER178Wp [Eremothecium gossypii ATCC 10895]AAS52859.1 AER178Wp [Eremothecium gossypii ATCC 10895]AEY97165.1 FAER178Wp [Eremothecium gossypii FDAG1]